MTPGQDIAGLVVCPLTGHRWELIGEQVTWSGDGAGQSRQHEDTYVCEACGAEDVRRWVEVAK